MKDIRLLMGMPITMEWTLGHHAPDSRGNRRYFTLANSPTEDELRVGVKFYEKSSSYKQAMLDLDPSTEIVAAQLAGDFTLPTNPDQKCVFIAGGIGITPFRSMIKFLLDTYQKRRMVLFYSVRSVTDFVYRSVFDEAQRKLGLKVCYTLTDTTRLPGGWQGKVGYVTADMIREEVPDWRECLYYVSGPQAMVRDAEQLLLGMGIKPDHIKTDFFPGLA